MPNIFNDELRDRVIAYIFSGKYKVGDRIPPERKICSDLDISRPKLREIIQSLCYMGYLRSVQGSGTYISNHVLESAVSSIKLGLEMEKKKLLEVWQVRYILETEAAALAAENAMTEELEALQATFKHYQDLVCGQGGDDEIVAATMAFHNAIVACSHNLTLAELLRHISELLEFSRYRTRSVPDSSERAVAYHEKLMLAILQRDPQLARKRMGEHLLDVRNDIYLYLQEQEEKEKVGE